MESAGSGVRGALPRRRAGSSGLIVVAQTGFVTLEALRWLHDAKAAFIQLDHDGTVLTSSIGGLDDARLRRAQALLPNTEHRCAIARELLEAKIKGQLAVLDSFGLGGAHAVREALALLDRADRLDVVLIAEGKAAEAYWDAWAGVPMQFAQRDHVPDHWRTFGMRRSPLTLAPRNAANPLNAILNLIYRYLEVETRIALTARGLDPGLALFHADEANRQSLAADVMEPVRPHVDAFVLNLARTRTFSAKDFAETREGACRLASSLAQELAPTMAQWARLVAPHAEGLARHVAQLAKSGLGVAAPIDRCPLGTAPESRCASSRSQRLPHPERCGRSRSPRRATPAAAAALSSTIPSAYTAINVCRIGAARRCKPRSQLSRPRGQRRSLPCAQLAMIQRLRPKPGVVRLPPPHGSARPSQRGAMTDRSTA